MRLKKDLFLNVTYSIFFALVILIENSELKIGSSSVILVFKSFISIAILILWLKALSRTHAGGILITDSSTIKGKQLLASGLNLIKDFLSIKVLCVVLLYSAYSIYTGSFNSEKISNYLVQTLAVGMYTLSFLIIGYAYFKLSVDNWLFVVLIYVPYFILFIIQGILDLESLQLLALIPSSLNLLFVLEISNPILIGLSSIIFITMVLLFFMSVTKLLKGDPKNLVSNFTF
jgi:hypothetical protein